MNKKLNILITLTSNNISTINNSLKKVLLSVDAAKSHNLKIFGLVDSKVIDKAYLMIRESGITILSINKNNIFYKSLKLRKIIKDYNIDIVHCAGFKQLALFSISLIGIKSVSIVMTERDTNRWDSKVSKLISMLALFLTKPNLHILNSRHFEYLKKHKSLYQNITMISNAIDDNPIISRIPQSKLDHSYLNLCYIKSIREDTGHSDILKLGLLIKESKLKILIHLIGAGPLYENFREQIQEHQLENIIATYGFIDNSKALNMLSEMDIGITTSPIEMLPNFILECFSVGIPVIGYKAQGIEDLIQNNENGYLVDKNDINKFFNKIKDLQNDNNKLKFFSKNALSSVSKYNYFNIGTKIINFYHKI